MFIQRNRWRMKRRTFLQAAGVSLALPWLEAMGIRSASVTNAGEITSSEIPRRTYFSIWGFFNNRAVPKDTGKDYTLTAPFDVLKDHKDDFTTANVTALQVPIRNESEAGAAKAKAETLWKQIQGGADFAALAKQYPVDGEFKTFKKSDKLPQDIKDAVLALKPGAVCRPVARPNGVFLIRLDSLTVKTLQEARGDIVKTLQDSAYQKWMDGVRKSVVIGK